MQANPILTALDKSGTTTKSGKNSTSGNPEISFNQMLNKEISSTKKPEMDVARPVNKPAPPAKNNNNVNANNNNAANSGNKLANNENTAPAPSNATKADESNTDGTVVKEDELDVKKDDDISEQILALVGNLNAAAVTTEAVKKPVANDIDTSKSDSLAAISSTDTAATTDLIDSNTVASLAKSAIENQGKVAGQSDSNATGKEQIKPETPATQADIAAIAAQMIASKADSKATAKLTENGSNAATSPIDKDVGKLTEAIIRPAELATPAPKDALAAKSTTTTGAEKPAETTVSETKVDDLSLSKTISDKTGDTRPAVATETPKSFASDISQAKDAMAERISDIKTGSAAKDSQQVMAPPAVAANAVGSTQFNAAVLAAEQIAPRVGSNGWDKAVGQKVVWMVGEGLQSAELTLNPPDLGPLQVVLKVSNEQASASFSSAQPEVREALEAALPRLKQMLSDAGVQLTGFSVNSQAAGQGQNFTQQQPRNINSSRIGTDVPDNTISTANTTPTRIQTNNGLVDTFA
ncbi:flagellar hook-length control protein FliK [Undibacterium sp. Ji83W]|uniref:flagellar hook-length control protein FliK n=1 Tax=Undibacterium sp. Ji83W TaxID=3413043 RepID=UPI003BF18898